MGSLGLFPDGQSSLGSLLPFFLGWIAFRQTRLAGWNPKPLLLACCWPLPFVLPWTIRNAVQFHKLIPLRSNFPFELWIGNNEIYDEHSREVNRITRYEQVHRYQELGETAFLAEKWQKAKDFHLEHPSLCLRLAGAVSSRHGSERNRPGRISFMPIPSLVRFLFSGMRVHLSWCTGFFWRLLPRSTLYFPPLAIVPVVFPLVYYFTQTSLRLRHPCDPVLALLLPLPFVACHCAERRVEPRKASIFRN